MTIYKNDPHYKVLYTSKNIFLMVENVKFRNDNNNTKSHILEFIIKLI